MQMDQYETLSVERDGSIDTLWLNRPENLSMPSPHLACSRQNCGLGLTTFMKTIKPEWCHK